jgi:hypothetical protein
MTLADEWLGYLVGEWDNDIDVSISGLIIPKQITTRASVDVLDCPENRAIENIVGVIHSHPFTSSAPSFSGTDERFINSNHDISIVMGNTGQYTILGRVPTPCGGRTVAKAELKIEFDEFEGAAREQITKAEVAVYTYPFQDKSIQKNKQQTELQNDIPTVTLRNMYATQPIEVLVDLQGSLEIMGIQLDLDYLSRLVANIIAGEKGSTVFEEEIIKLLDEDWYGGE